MTNIYLNASTVSANKCVFVQSTERIIQRTISNQFIFYKAVNLITEERNFSVSSCELTFHLLQFMVHLNLRTDEEFDIFYETCHDILTNKTNNFKLNFRKCHYDSESEEITEANEKSIINRLSLVFTDHYYLAIIALLVSMLAPYFLLIPILELLKKSHHIEANMTESSNDTSNIEPDKDIAVLNNVEGDLIILANGISNAKNDLIISDLDDKTQDDLLDNTETKV